MTDTRNLLNYVTVAGRVCPMPIHWAELWRLLVAATPGVDEGKPPPPLILAAWYEASDEDKRERLKRQVEWAAAHEVLDVVEAFVTELNEGQWHYRDAG